MFKNYAMTLHWQTHKAGLWTDCTRNAVLNCDGEQFQLRDIRTFLDDVKKIYRQIGVFKKDDKSFDLEITVSTYQRKDSDKYYLDSKDFDRWTFRGCVYQDDDGLYMSADNQYTEANRDFYLTFKGDIFTEICDKAYWQVRK